MVSSDFSIDWQENIHRFGTVGSTMDEARSLAAAGAGHGTIVVAERQDAGRGRSGRVWASPPGNLHATVILRPGVEAQHAPQLGFVVAVAVAQAVDRLAGPSTALKWPNDIMRDGAKLAGILMERIDDGAVLAGIGMNVRHHPLAMPYPVTSLRVLGCEAGSDTVLGAIQDALREEWAVWRAQGFSEVRRRWLARGPADGTRLMVRLGTGTIEAGTIEGSFAGLREDGALLLDTADGRRALVGGDVQPCAKPPDMAKTVAC